MQSTTATNEAPPSFQSVSKHCNIGACVFIDLFHDTKSWKKRECICRLMNRWWLRWLMKFAGVRVRRQGRQLQLGARDQRGQPLRFRDAAPARPRARHQQDPNGRRWCECFLYNTLQRVQSTRRFSLRVCAPRRQLILRSQMTHLPPTCSGRKRITRARERYTHFCEFPLKALQISCPASLHGKKPQA